MKKYSCPLFVLTIGLLSFSACTAAPKLSPMQARQITTKMFESGYENIYRATLTVLQDQGYVIKNTDMASGLILASVDRKKSGGSQFFQALMVGYVPNKGTEIELSCVVNKLNETSTELRINIQEVKYGQSSVFSGSGKQDTKQIYDPKVYENLFNDIQLEVKRREAINK